MALTINSVFRNAFARAEVEPVYLVRIQLTTGSAEGTDCFTFATKAGWGYPASVSDVSPIAAEIDVVTRRFKSGEQSLTFRDDDALRGVIAVHRMKGKIVDLLLGAVGMSEASFVRVARMVIKDWSQREGEIGVQCADAASLLRSTEIGGTWVDYHPLELIELFLQRANVPTSLYDATTLDPSNYTTSISHFNISRENIQVPQIFLDSGLHDSRINSMDAVNELCELLQGSFIPNESGVFGFYLYDAAAGIERTLYGTDIGRLEQTESVNNLGNEFIVTFGRSSNYPSYSYTRRDTVSIAAHATPGATDGKYASQPLDSGWLNGIAYHQDPNAITPATPSFVVQYAAVAGICGCRYQIDEFGREVRPTWAEASVDRPVYIRIEGEFEGGITEVVSIVDIYITGPAMVAGGYDTSEVVSDSYGFGHRKYLEFTIGSRALFGTSSPANWVPGAIHRIVDLTIPIAMADIRIPRFANGIELISFSTSMRHFDLQVGDFVAIVDDQPIGYGLDGSGLASTWEIIRKEVQPLDDSPKIQWLVGRVITDGGGVVVEDDNPPAEYVTPLPDNNVIMLDGDDVLMSDGQKIYLL